MLERKERGGEAAGPAVRSTLQQCGLLQDLIDISLSNLRGLRTKCAASNDLTQQEIRTLEVRAGEAPAPGCAGPGAGPYRQHQEPRSFRVPGRGRRRGAGGEEEGEPLPLCPGLEGIRGTRKGSRKGGRPPPRASCGASPSCRGSVGPPASRHPAGRARRRCPRRGKARRAGQVREPRAGRDEPPPLRAAAARLPACGGLSVRGGRCGARRGPEVLSECLAEPRRRVPCPRMLDAQTFPAGLRCLFLVAPVLSFQACLSIPGSVSLI